MVVSIVHGGTDNGPPILHDFSTNGHPLGPPPLAMDAVLKADRLRYPDPSYAALRECLGNWHDVDPSRVLPCAGGSEAIRRLSLAALLEGVTTVCVPQPGFADYGVAAEVLGLTVRGYSDAAGLATLLDQLDRRALVWVCDPCNPTGASFTVAEWLALDVALQRHDSRLVVDQAYEPLRLVGSNALPAVLSDRAWRMMCPNKALGLTGVRGAYLLAPRADDGTERLLALASSWVLSSEGQAMLMAWTLPAVQSQLRESLQVLRDWQGIQWRRLASLGMRQRAGSVANFWLARLPSTDHRTAAEQLARLRAQGIKLRDASSFGMPGWVRLSVQAPPALEALVLALGPMLDV
ncbi:pyridoxal phosphate-dependent aminotransferase [Roseateles amylovorans]|uniref:Aminotransferase class I/II-fold pyridoxal phosphate-dependent enzyme n=1 Tax=Roseateles amylovorans TaxID=2978473 RepID=A0ABY6AWV4_9BURK|nr:aminotransferase class I/II-fold pyridoxal phosphate-dependent enzyme [Roseateles amylovorans]UXH77457.1 aminotransferase class I/II-fold pyridoxal phosphate-dependent enzyme [Roseateles amylovorans]